MFLTPLRLKNIKCGFNYFRRTYIFNLSTSNSQKKFKTRSWINIRNFKIKQLFFPSEPKITTICINYYICKQQALKIYDQNWNEKKNQFLCFIWWILLLQDDKKNVPILIFVIVFSALIIKNNSGISLPFLIISQSSSRKWYL